MPKVRNLESENNKRVDYLKEFRKKNAERDIINDW